MSVHVVSGVIDSAYTKTVHTKFGDKPVYHYTVDGVDFSTGFKSFHSQGEMVNVPVEWKYGGWQKVDGAAPDGAPKATAQGGGSVSKPNFGGGASRAPSRTFPVDPHDGQMSIIRQNSMNRAVEIVGKWADLGLVQFKSEDEYLQKLIEVALTVTDFNSGQDIMKLQAAMAANKAIAGE